MEEIFLFLFLCIYIFVQYFPSSSGYNSFTPEYYITYSVCPAALSDTVHGHENGLRIYKYSSF